MMETDDKLIREFFATAKQEVPDNGFSHRVMKNLPCHTNRLAKLWSIFVTLIALMLFFGFGGLQAIVETLREVFVSMVQSSATSIDPKTMVIAVIVLLFLGVRKAWTMT